MKEVKCSIRKGGNWCPIKKARCVKGDFCTVAHKRKIKRNKLAQDLKNTAKMLGLEV